MTQEVQRIGKVAFLNWKGCYSRVRYMIMCAWEQKFTITSYLKCLSRVVVFSKLVLVYYIGD